MEEESRPARRKAPRYRRVAAWALAFCLGWTLYLTGLFWVDVYALRKGSFSIKRLSADRKKELQIPVGPKTKNWVPLSKVSRYAKEAVLAAEDDAFYEHSGFHWTALRKALWENIKRGKVIRGGSTITQQLSKNLFFSLERSYARKGSEAYLALWLELVFTKDELFELYLNAVEFGPDLYGIGPAAKYYFGRKASALSIEQSAFLATLLPAPKRYHRFAVQGLDKGARRRYQRVLEGMRQRKAISWDEYGRAIDAPVGFRPGIGKK
ncbi:MAG: monofunctional biosynthetic peptidoglycan transglycosylase [Bdellovibrionota bacterium]